MKNEDLCIAHCPIVGHRPLCSIAECREQGKNDGWGTCYRRFKEGSVMYELYNNFRSESLSDVSNT